MFTSVAEVETHGVFQNAKRIISIRYVLEAIGHKQIKPTPLRTDNSTSSGFVNKNMQMKQSKAWDMQLHWLRDKPNKEIFNVFWDKGPNNGADYFTKYHPTVHHRRIRIDRKYIRDMHSDLRQKVNLIFSQKVSKNTSLQGCVKPGHNCVPD